MADGTKIEWTDATVNAVNGCSVVSPGCTHCYAMRLAGTRMKHHPSRAGLAMPTKAGPVWTGEVRLNERAMLEPLRWKRPRRIFWNAHGDLFHENVPDEWIDRCFAVMALTPQHQHQVLTKRAQRMRAYLSDGSWPGRVSEIVNGWPGDRIGTGNEFTADFNLCFGQHLPNVWLGVSVEDQARANERIPDLLATPAAVRFLSCEPLLGAVNLRRIRIAPDHHTIVDALDGYAMCDTPGRERERTQLDWVIAGGESGPKARPMHPDWTRSLRDQCAAAGVPFFFKQWGEWAPSGIECVPGTYTGGGIFLHPNGYWGCQGDFWKGIAEPMDRVGKKVAGRLLDGVAHDGMPG